MSGPVRRCLSVFILVGFFVLSTCPAGADDRAVKRKRPETGGRPEHRIALIIGNSGYESSPLKNPVNDAKTMAAALEKVGFQVTMKTDLNQKAMKRAIDNFGRQLTGGSVALFYFAGHGIQVGGHNYLVPVSAEIVSEEDVEYEAVRADRVLAKMERAKPRVNIVILDACRNNPFARSFRSGSQGLAHMDAPSGTIIAYATAPGSVASDGPGNNGLYTQELIKHIRSPGLTIEEVFKKVRAGVQSQSENKQTPWESSSLVGNFYFNIVVVQQPEAVVVNMPPPSAGPQVSGERPLQGTVKVVGNLDGARFYLAGKEFTTKTGVEITIDRVPAGSHTITAKKEGYSDWHSTIVVTENQTVRLDIHMTPVSTGYQQTPSLDQPPGMQSSPGETRLFVDSVYHFSMNIPENWTTNIFEEETDRVMAAISPDQNLVVRVRAFPVGPDVTLDQIRLVFENLIQSTVLQYTGQTLSHQVDSLNGLQGRSAVYQGYYNGVQVGMLAFFTVQNQVCYIVWTMIPTQIVKARASEVEAVVRTFTLVDR